MVKTYMIDGDYCLTTAAIQCAKNVTCFSPDST